MTAIYIDDTPTQNSSFRRIILRRIIMRRIILHGIILRRIILRGIGTRNMTAIYINDTPTQNNFSRRIILRLGFGNHQRGMYTFHIIFFPYCNTFVRALVYCNFLKEVRLGGWGQTRKCVRYYS